MVLGTMIECLSGEEVGGSLWMKVLFIVIRNHDRVEMNNLTPALRGIFVFLALFLQNATDWCNCTGETLLVNDLLEKSYSHSPRGGLDCITSRENN